MRRKIGLAVAGVLVLAGSIAGTTLALGWSDAAAEEDATSPPGLHAACEDGDHEAMMAVMEEVVDEESYQEMFEHMGDEQSDSHGAGEHDGGMMGAGHMGGSMGSGQGHRH